MAGGQDQVFQLKFEVPSDPKLLSVVRSAVLQVAAVAGLPEEECRSITLAVDEALANIIRHAYENRAGQPIEVSCRRVASSAPAASASRLEFLLVDWGRSVHPSELQGRSLGEVEPGGLGMHLIRSIMDEVHYEPCGDHNCLRLVKYLAPARPVAPEGE